MATISNSKNLGMYRNMQVQKMTIKNVVLYVKNGKVTLAKCVKTGRFVSLSLAKCLYNQNLFWLNLKSKNEVVTSEQSIKENTFFSFNASFNIVAMLAITVLFYVLINS